MPKDKKQDSRVETVYEDLVPAGLDSSSYRPDTKEEIVRRYSDGVASAFLNELNAGHIPGEAPGEVPANRFSLVEAFIHYINRASVRS